MAWLVLTLGAALFFAGIAGQIFGLGGLKRVLRPEDKRVGMLVMYILLVVGGLWLVFISVAHFAHLSFTGKW